jgi:hypothetical protein
MWTYDIWVKMWFNLKYSITWILGAMNMQKNARICNKYFAMRLVAWLTAKGGYVVCLRYSARQRFEICAPPLRTLE